MSASSYEPALSDLPIAEALPVNAKPQYAAARRLLSCLLACEVDAASVVSSVSTLGTLWIRKQGLAALTWAACRSATKLTPEAADDLHRVYYAAGADAELHRRELAVVLQAMAVQGVSPIVFKGGALAYSVYPDPACRPMGDLDFWVTVDEMLRAQTALEQIGYRSTEKLDRPLAMMQQNRGEVRMISTAPGTGLVELHWGVFPGEWLRWTANVDEAGICSRAIPITLVEQPALTLAPEDGIVQIAVHASVNHQLALSGVRSLVDVALLAKANPIDWEIIVERARVWRVATATWLVLKLAIELTGLHEAASAVRQLSPSPLRCWLISRFANAQSLIDQRDLTRGPLRFVFLLLLVDRRRDAIRLVWRTLWPDRDWLLARYNRAGLSMRLRHLLDAARGKI